MESVKKQVIEATSPFSFSNNNLDQPSSCPIMNFFQLLRVHFLVVSALENFEPEDRLSVSSSPSSSFLSPLLSLLFLFRSCCCHEGADHDQ